MRILTVDWDYFLELPPAGDMQKTLLYDWDCGEGFAPILQDIKWFWRGTAFLRAKLPLPLMDDSFREFWHRVDLSKCKIAEVEDSHVHGWPFATLRNRQECPSIVNVDAHHDCGYKGEDFSPIRYWDNRSQVECDDWLAATLHMRPGTTAKIVYPQWRKAVPETTPTGVSRQNYDPVYDDGRHLGSFDKLLIVRSSAWTPPWTDGQFNDFLDLCPMPLDHMDERGWDSDAVKEAAEMVEGQFS